MPFFFNQNGQSLKEELYYDNGNLLGTKIFEYKNDILIKEINSFSTNENILDATGKVIYTRQITRKDTSITEEFEYDKNGKLQKLITYLNKTIYFISNYKYLANGICEREVEYVLDKNFRKYNKIIYVSDSLNNALKIINMHDNDTISIRTEEKINNIVLSKEYFIKEKTESITYYEKDKFGNTICIKNIPDMPCETRYEYTYDEKGNILTKVQYEKGRLKYKDQYKYEYW